MGDRDEGASVAFSVRGHVVLHLDDHPLQRLIRERLHHGGQHAPVVPSPADVAYEHGKPSTA